MKHTVYWVGLCSTEAMTPMSCTQREQSVHLCQSIWCQIQTEGDIFGLQNTVGHELWELAPDSCYCFSHFSISAV